LNNLHQIGLAFHNYLDISKTILPVAAQVPSVTPTTPTLPTVLAPYIENSATVFQCPLDQFRYMTPVGDPSPLNPSLHLEGLSYEYSPRVQGKKLVQLENNARNISLSDVWIVYDFDPCHARGAVGYLANSDNDDEPTLLTALDSRCFLYADGHAQ
jgi:hypothetical protein